MPSVAAPIGIRATVLLLRLDDFLWFSSYEWGGDNETIPVLHGYALSYALSRYERVLSVGAVPSYEEDLEAIDVYCTPARLVAQPRSRQRGVFTFNSVDNPTQLTQALRIGEKVNDPKFGKRQVLLPGLRFELVAFTRRDAMIPRVIRLGKKRAPIVVEERENVDLSRPFEGDGTPDHAVSPVDVTGRIVRCLPCPIPPHMVFERAEIEKDVFARTGKRLVHIPARVRQWASG
jgi:CRISPR type I-D-associated protein Csc1